jgi:hypothetical protein
MFATSKTCLAQAIPWHTNLKISFETCLGSSKTQMVKTFALMEIENVPYGPMQLWMFNAR